MKSYLYIALPLLLLNFFTFQLFAAEEKAEEKTADPKSSTTSSPIPKDNKNSSPQQNESEKTAHKPPLSFFHTIILTAPGNLYITQSDELDLTIETQPKIQNLITASVQNQILTIDMKNASEHTQDQINYYLKIKTLQSITSYSSSTIFIKDHFETKVFNIAILSGFGEAHLNLDVTKLTTKISGAAKIEVTGVADEQVLSINGIGEFTGNKLKSKLANVSINGSGIAKMNASEELNIKLNGNGNVYYCGKPNINKEISGQGNVAALDSSDCN